MELIDVPGDYLKINIRWWGYLSMHNLLWLHHFPAFAEQI